MALPCFRISVIFFLTHFPSSPPFLRPSFSIFLHLSSSCPPSLPFSPPFLTPSFSPPFFSLSLLTFLLCQRANDKISLVQPVLQRKSSKKKKKQNVYSTFKIIKQRMKPFSSVQFSPSVVLDSLQPHESQHARPPCPSPTPGVHSDSHPSSR